MRQKKIQYYDSMAAPGTAYLRHLLQYLQDEMQHKKKEKLDTSEWTLVGTTDDTPQQMNGYDCGVFVCANAECLSFERPLNFSQRDMPNIRKRMVHRIVQGYI